MTEVLAPPRRTVHQALDDAWSSPPGLLGFLSAVNHKQIGLRFVWTAVAFLFVGGIEALLVRVQLARAENDVLSPETYNQLFTMHGTTMMFLFAVPILEGLAMYLTPLQIGTRDMPFPRLNAFGYWCYLFGGVLLNWSLVSGSVPDGGWFAYTPLSGPEFSPSRALDFWLIGITLVEIAGILGAVELIVLLLKQRAPGMNLARIPLFCWSVLVMATMMLIAFPVVLTASLLLELERKVGAPFYDAAAGGNPLLWQHLFWIFGHPEVYIMLTPATGIVSAVVAAHTGRRIVAYPLVVAALISVGIASFGLWVHHMFTVGLPQVVLGLFAVASFAIAIPSGVQIFAWIATIWEGVPRWRTPMWFVMGFIVTFVLGGFTGVMVASPPFDGQAHDSYFVVAHFHYVLIGGVVFPIFAGLHHWFPTFTGRLPNERVGRASCGLQLVGFHITFFPQHLLGLQGMARRVYTYAEDLGWDALNLVSTAGSFVFGAGVTLFIGNLAWARRRGPRSPRDPWTADTLEWSTTAPPPSYNFVDQPVVSGRSPQWDRQAPAFDAQTLEALAALAHPHRGRREVVRTSVFDARPEAIFSLPGPSVLPLCAALALSVALTGVLVDWWPLAIGGAAGFGWALVAWLNGNGAHR
ncbi:MAG: cytochrome c oxidase subunit I [Acidimicrobiia bacterium]